MTSTTQDQSGIRGASLQAAAGLALAILFVLTVVVAQTAQAQTFNIIHSFTGGGDGANPEAGLTKDAAGNLYGTAAHNGGGGHGTAFRLRFVNSGWIFTPLYSFKSGNDGAAPVTKVILGANGSLYGTTARGGNEVCNFCGTVFNLQPPATASRSALSGWSETVLYRFSGTDGSYPVGDPAFDRAGSIYGVTEFGGSGDQGAVYELTPSGGGWSENVLYSFPGGASDGYFPQSGVALDNIGNLYGTTYYGGTYGAGTVYRLTPSGSGWAENILYNFQAGDDGGYPFGGLIFDQFGNLYAATPTGGSGGGGTVFELTPSDGNWTFSVLYSFSAGTGPYGSLTMDAAGNLYGTTFTVGAYGYGSVFKLTFSGGGWSATDLHDFTGGSDGGNPFGNVTLKPNGKLYGTASGGGAYGLGVVWEITP